MVYVFVFIFLTKLTIIPISLEILLQIPGKILLYLFCCVKIAGGGITIVILLKRSQLTETKVQKMEDNRVKYLRIGE